MRNLLNFLLKYNYCLLFCIAGGYLLHFAVSF